MLKLSEEQLSGIYARRGHSRAIHPPLYNLQKFIVDSLELCQIHQLKSPLINTLNIGLKDLQKNDSKPKPYERIEQAIALVWLACNNSEAFDHTTAIPLGGYRPKGAGGQVKAEGCKAGYPDFLMDVPMNGYHGLRIEMKKHCKSANPSEDQLDWLTRLSRQGYRAVLCRGHQAAVYELASYLSMRPPYNLTDLPEWAIQTYQ